MEKRYKPVRWWRVAVVIVLLAVVQTSVVGWVTFRGARLVLLLPLVITFGCRTNARAACGLAFIAGVTQDLFSGVSLGTYTLAFTLAGWMCSQVAERSFMDDAVPMAVVSFSIAFGVSAVCAMFALWNLHDIRLILGRCAYSAMLVAGVCVAANPFVKKVSDWFGLTGKMVF